MAGRALPGKVLKQTDWDASPSRLGVCPLRGRRDRASREGATGPGVRSAGQWAGRARA